MSQLMVLDQRFPLDRQLQERHARQVSSMQLIAEVAKEAMDGVSEVHGYAAYKAMVTVAAEQAILDATAPAGERKPLEEAARYRRRSMYLDSMNRIAEAASARIVSLSNGDGR